LCFTHTGIIASTETPQTPQTVFTVKTPFARAFITLLFKSLKSILKTFFRAREYKLFILKV
jgi:hypothetical protein